MKSENYIYMSDPKVRASFEQTFLDECSIRGKRITYAQFIQVLLDAYKLVPQDSDHFPDPSKDRLEGGQ